MAKIRYEPWRFCIFHCELFTACSAISLGWGQNPLRVENVQQLSREWSLGPPSAGSQIRPLQTCFWALWPLRKSKLDETNVPEARQTVQKSVSLKKKRRDKHETTAPSLQCEVHFGRYCSCSLCRRLCRSLHTPPEPLTVGLSIHIGQKIYEMRLCTTWIKVKNAFS